MFSNLRTETGHANHPRRLVVVRQDAGVTGIRVEYLRDRVPRVVTDAITDPELAAPMPWWERRPPAFRAIGSGPGPGACRW